MTDYPAVAEQYARDVVSGKIPAAKYIRLACQRHLDDLDWQGSDGFAFRFDAKAATKACKFIELMPHTKGKWAAQRLTLKMEPWQVFMTVCLFGWLRRKDNTRRFRRFLLLVPRKNGKSAWAAAVGLFMLCADGEFGAEVYSGATNEKQAWEVFKPARLMAQKLPQLCSHYGVTVNASNIHILGNGAKFEPIVGDPGDGASPSLAIVDEYHEHQTNKQFDTMETGMGAREQPLMLVITTAGDNIAGPCYMMQDEAQKMLEGARNDDETLALIYGIDNEERTDIVQSYNAIRELDSICQKNDAQITLTKKSVREVFARVATQLGDVSTQKTDVKTTQNAPQGQEHSAGHVTNGCSERETLNTKSGKTTTGANGQKGTGSPERHLKTSGGSTPKTKPSSWICGANQNTELSQSNFPKCVMQAAESARSAASSQSNYALIIAMILDASEEFSADSAMLQSAFWEITKLVWNQHSSIFEEAKARIGARSLAVRRPPDDWTDPAILRKANPNMGVSVGEDFLLARQKDAIRSPRKAGVFKTKHLNVWVQSRSAYYNVQRFSEVADAELKLSDFEGQECIIGVDLAEKRDLTAIEYTFRHGKGYACFGKYYAPEETIEQPENEHLRTWRDSGLLIQIDGAVVDQREILEDIKEDLSRFDVREVSFDPWRSRQMAVELTELGVNCIEFRGSPSNMNEPMREMDALIANGSLHHDGNQAFTWMLSNVVNGTRTGEMHRPAKERPENKIDGPVARMLALGRWMLDEEKGASMNDYFASLVEVVE